MNFTPSDPKCVLSALSTLAFFSFLVGPIEFPALGAGEVFDYRGRLLSGPSYIGKDLLQGFGVAWPPSNKSF